MSQLELSRPNVLSRRRSHSVLPSLHPPLPIANRFHHHGDLLYCFLPRLTQTTHRFNIPIEMAVQEVSNSSDDIEERGGLPGLPVQGLEQTYMMVYEAIIGSTNEWDVSNNIHRFLEDILVEDQRRPYNGRNLRTSMCIRALAEISRLENSLRMGQLLAEFFLRSGVTIMNMDMDIDSVYNCAHGINRAVMPREQKWSCFGIILKYSPGLVDWLQQYGLPRDYSLVRQLDRLADDLGSSNFRGRRREWYPSNRRRLFSRTRSPDDYLGSNRRSMYESPRDLMRPRSAPGDRQIVRQADRFIDEAVRLQDMVEQR